MPRPATNPRRIMKNPAKPIGRRGVLALLSSAPFAAKDAAAQAAGIGTVGKVVGRYSYLPTAGAGPIKDRVVSMLLRGESLPPQLQNEWRRR